MSPPKIWGKYFWTTFHFVSLAYPDSPSTSTRQIYKNWYANFGHVLPCRKCSENYERHFLELPIEPYLENSNKLFEWTVRVHNIVNKELGKPIWSVEFAKMHYMYLDKGKKNNSSSSSPWMNLWNSQTMMKVMMGTNLILVLIVIYILLRKRK